MSLVSNANYVNCDNIYNKCEMRKKLVELYNSRKMPGTLGYLGNVRFRPVDKFLTEALSSTKHCTSGVIKTKSEQRVVAVGDVHGDLLALLSALFMMDLIDDDCRWIGKDSIFVQCGDFLDRGGRGSATKNTSGNNREEVDIVQYMYYLNVEAMKCNGRVVSVLGNHEVGTVWSHTSYFDRYNVFLNSPQLVGWSDVADKGLLDGHDHLSFKVKLFEPGGSMARYMACYVPLILQVNNYLFMHGGLTFASVQQFTSDPGSDTVKMMNAAFRRALYTEGHRIPGDALLGVVMDRSLSETAVTETQNDICKHATKKLFRALKLNWETGGIVVGHSIQKGGIPYYCHGKVWRVDLGLSEAFGRASKKDPLGALRITLNSSAFEKKTIVERFHNYRTPLEPKYETVIKEISYFLNGMIVFTENVQHSSKHSDWVKRFRSTINDAVKTL